MPLAQLPAANYVFAYDAAPQTVASAGSFQDVTFGADAQISGWTHTAGTASYTCGQTGLYLIQYHGEAQITASSGIIVSMIALVNGSTISGSQGAVAMTVAGVTSVISKSCIASLTAGDIVSLQLTASSTSAKLIATGSGSAKPSVSMTIVRIQ